MNENEGDRPAEAGGIVTLSTEELQDLVARAASEAARAAVAETKAEREAARAQAMETADRQAAELERKARELIESSPYVRFCPEQSMAVTVQGYRHQFVAGQTEEVRQVFVDHYWINVAAQAEADRLKAALVRQYQEKVRAAGLG